MAHDVVRIDTDPTPSLAELAREVRHTGMTVVLREKGEDVAVLSPTTPKRRRQVSPAAGRTSPRRRTKALTADDPLFHHVGTSHADVPDVSGNKHRHLADAYQTKGRGQVYW